LSYLESGGSKRFTAPVISHFGIMPLGKIDQDAIDKAARKLYPDAGPATRDRQCYAIASAILHHAAKRGWCAKPIIERPKLPDGRGPMDHNRGSRPPAGVVQRSFASSGDIHALHRRPHR
jgi:hypothetical protein